MRTIAIINQKGGCGKTTVALNLSSALAAKGRRTLLVDMDPQGHCAVGLAVPEDQIEESIYDILISHAKDEPFKVNEILWQISEKFELAPASIDLAAFEQQMAGIVDRENCLKKVLDHVNDQYDYVVIDCPPSVGLLTFNALRAANDVIVPVDTGYFSLHGLSRQLETLDVLCKQCHQQINVMVLASMYDIRTKMAREILAELRKHFSERMFKTTVNFNTKLKEAASLGQPICEYDPSSKGSNDFLALAEELMSSDSSAVKLDAGTRKLSRELDAISMSAKELLDEVNPSYAGRDEITAGRSKQQPQALSTEVSRDAETDAEKLDKKLADFYGVKQSENAVMFVSLYPRAKSVQIAGDFNNWQPESANMEKVGDNGQWQLNMPLNPGYYRYRLVVDGQWQQDPYNERTEMNPYGDLNSVLEVV